MKIALTPVFMLLLAAAAGAVPALLSNGVGVARVDDLRPADLMRRGAVQGADAAVVRALSGTGYYALRVEIPAGGEFRPAKMAAESARLVVSGTGAVIHAGRRHEVRPGAIALYPPGASPSVMAGSPMVVLLVAPRRGGLVFEPQIQLDPLSDSAAPGSRTPLMSAGALTVERLRVGAAPTRETAAQSNTIFAVLRGAALFRFGSENAGAEAGSFVRVPAGTRYRVSAPGGADLLAIAVR
jgi:mannose-6-phosphate isomerase-like protein (cupin superfamily)